MDEEGVHHSFHELIAEQSGATSEAYELQRLQRELDDEGRGTAAVRTVTELDIASLWSLRLHH